MISRLTRLANHLDSKSLTKEADVLDSIIIRLAQEDFEVGETSRTTSRLREFGLDSSHYIVRAGDPYRYIYVPQRNMFLVVEYYGSRNKSWVDELGNATRDIPIREGDAGWDILVQEAIDRGLIESEPSETEEVQNREESGLTAVESNGTRKWRQYRNPDGTVAYYIDDSGRRLNRVQQGTVIQDNLGNGRAIAQVGEPPSHGPDLWTVLNV